MSDLKDFKIENGVLKEYIGEGGNVIIPEGVTKIGSFAFKGNAQIVSVIISEGVKEIEEMAFQECYGLQKVIIPSSVTRIGFSAFSKCEALTSLTISKGISMEYGVFYGCKGLVDENGFIIVNGVLFNYYGKASTVTIPPTVHKIHEFSFFNCDFITEINIPASIKCIGGEAFTGCSAIKNLVIPEGVETIGESAFSRCNSLQTISVGNSIKTITGVAFKNCKNISIIIAPSLESFNIVFNALDKDVRLNVLINAAKSKTDNADVLTKIKANKKKLMEMLIEADDAEAIAFIFSLYKVIPINELENYINIAENKVIVKSFILEYKDKHYSKTEQVKYEKREQAIELGITERSVAEWKKIFSWEKCEGGIAIKGYIGDDIDVVIPEKIGNYTVVDILTEAFSPEASRIRSEIREKREKIRSVVIPGTIKKLEIHIFYKCKNLSEITIQNGVEEINQLAFFDCGNVSKVSLPKSVTKIPYNPFYQSQKVAISAPAGSYAEKFAKEYNIPFVAE